MCVSSISPVASQKKRRPGLRRGAYSFQSQAVGDWLTCVSPITSALLFGGQGMAAGRVGSWKQIESDLSELSELDIYEDDSVYDGNTIDDELVMGSGLEDDTIDDLTGEVANIVFHGPGRHPCGGRRQGNPATPRRLATGWWAAVTRAAGGCCLFSCPEHHFKLISSISYPTPLLAHPVHLLTGSFSKSTSVQSTTLPARFEEELQDSATHGAFVAAAASGTRIPMRNWQSEAAAAAVQQAGLVSVAASLPARPTSTSHMMVRLGKSPSDPCTWAALRSVILGNALLLHAFLQSCNSILQRMSHVGGLEARRVPRWLFHCPAAMLNCPCP